MSVINWIIGPQLIGACFLITGLVSARFPPKNINPMYGYRTKASMKNQETWDEANQFSIRYMIKCSWALLIVGLLISFVFSTGVIPDFFVTLLRPVLLILGAIAFAVMIFIATEKHLKRKFPEPAE